MMESDDRLFPEAYSQKTCMVKHNYRVINGQLRCERCNARIPSKPHSEVWEPKYPHCPWCGVKMNELLFTAEDWQ